MSGKTRPSSRVLKYVVVVGCFLIKMPVGVDWYYGNLSTYTNSYFRFIIGPSAFDFNSDWIIPAHLVLYAMGVFSVAIFAKRFSMPTIELAAIVFGVSWTFLSYFAMQHSVAFLFMTIGVCSSFAGGIVTMVCLKFGSDVMPERVGLVTAVLSVGINAGAFINNFSITAFINPRNLSPDAYLQGTLYFSQTSVIDNVPDVFILLGTLSAILQFLGFVLQQLPFVIWDNKNKTTCEKNTSESTASTNEQTLLSNTSEEEHTKLRTVVVHSPNQDNDDTNDIINSTSLTRVNQEQSSCLTPSQVLRRKSFYLLWLGRFVLTYNALLFLNSYKSLGQLWIKDDAFLASIGSLGSATNGLSRILGGLIVDKFGVKRAFMFGVSLNTMLLPFWYLSPRLDRWIYFLCCQALIGVHGFLLIIFPTATLKLYGPTHYAANYGLVMLSSVTTGLTCPLTFYLLQLYFQWYSLVFFGSVISTLALILSVFTLPG